jgi:hypothetical protein
MISIEGKRSGISILRVADRKHGFRPAERDVQASLAFWVAVSASARMMSNQKSH